MRHLYIALYPSKIQSALQGLMGNCKWQPLQFLFENNVRFNRCPYYRESNRPQDIFCILEQYILAFSKAPLLFSWFIVDVSFGNNIAVPPQRFLVYINWLLFIIYETTDTFFNIIYEVMKLWHLLLTINYTSQNYFVCRSTRLAQIYKM